MICRTHIYCKLQMSKDTATVEGYSNWLETDSEVGRCKHVGDFLIFVRPKVAHG